MRCHDGEQVEASMASERLGPRESVARRARQGFQLSGRLTKALGALGF